MKHTDNFEWVFDMFYGEMYGSNITIGRVYRAPEHGLFRGMIAITITNWRPKLKHSCNSNTSYCFTFFLDICVFS